MSQTESMHSRVERSEAAELVYPERPIPGLDSEQIRQDKLHNLSALDFELYIHDAIEKSGFSLKDFCLLESVSKGIADSLLEGNLPRFLAEGRFSPSSPVYHLFASGLSEDLITIPDGKNHANDLRDIGTDAKFLIKHLKLEGESPVEQDDLEKTLSLLERFSMYKMFRFQKTAQVEAYVEVLQAVAEARPDMIPQLNVHLEQVQDATDKVLTMLTLDLRAKPNYRYRDGFDTCLAGVERIAAIAAFEPQEVLAEPVLAELAASS